MSLLGFDALGRWALGQLPTNGNFVLLGAPGSIALAGRSAVFATSEPATVAGFLQAGMSAGFRVAQPGSPGSVVFAGNAAAAGVRQASLGGSFLQAGVAATTRVRVVASTSAILLSGASLPFSASFALGPGALAWAGGSAAYNRGHEAWVRRPFDTMSWRAEAMSPPPIWSGGAALASAWTADMERETAWTPASIEPTSWTTE